MERVLVTGGAGFIGSNFIRHLLNNTSHVAINLDKLTYRMTPQSATLKQVPDNQSRTRARRHAPEDNRFEYWDSRVTRVKSGPGKPVTLEKKI